MVPPTQVNVPSRSTVHLNMFSRQNMKDHIGITPIMESKEWMDSLADSQFTIQVIELPGNSFLDDLRQISV